MTIHEATDLYWDPFDAALNERPYELFRRLRDEAPLYYNEKHDFYVLSRADDVERAFADHKRLINGRSDVIEFIKAGIEFPPGMFIFEDPPRHTKHRGVLSRVFTPRRMAAIEPQVREYAGRTLDQYVGSGGFDFVKEYAEIVSSRSIGLVLGIPEADQLTVREHTDGRQGEGYRVAKREAFEGGFYAEYIQWREDNPSDDLMTDMLNVEFEDEEGVTRKLTREEILTQVNLLSGAGNDTTAKLIGWTGSLLAEHPDQRREIAEDRSLIPQTIEEVLRYESPGMQNARWVVEDVEFSGGTIPAESAVVTIMASGNHDERRFPDPERFDIHRKPIGILSFSFGAHFCIGAAMARLQGRVALDEMLDRFPEWSVDEAGAKMQVTSTTRGWGNLPITI